MPATTPRLTPRFGAVLLLLAALSGGPAAANEVRQWNETAGKVALANGQNPPQLTRSIAMVQGAVHDALNAIRPRYAPYYFQQSAAGSAAPQAAVASATRGVLTGLLPAFGSPEQRAEAQAQLDAAYQQALAGLPEGAPKQEGIAVGQAAAAAMLLLRKEDGAGRGAPYTPAPGPGRWRPTPNPEPANPPIRDPKAAPGFGASTLPGWGNVTPFTLLNSAQFWSPGPPALGSAQYARDFNEVKAVGGQVSSQRTPEQTEIARFWFEGPTSWYRLTRVVGEARGFDAWDDARALAIVSLAMADAFISGFKIRYVYDFWRPVTAIREAADDGNDATAADPGWNSLQNTPSVSDYPSTQSVFSGAAAAALIGVIGSDQIGFSMSSGPPFANIRRSFTSLSQAARESADSRVYAGIHFRSACEDGLQLGRRIGERTVLSYLQPLRKGP